MFLLVEQRLNGQQFGWPLFLLAAGLTLVFGIMDLVNLAHGSFDMLGAYFAATFAALAGSFVLGAVVAMAATLVAGMAAELIAIRKAVYSRPGFPASMKAIAALRTPEIRERNAVTDDDYAAQKLPVLLVWTDHEPSGDPDVGRHLAELMPHGQFVLVEGAAHWPQWENPELFNDAVIRFLEGVTA